MPGLQQCNLRVPWLPECPQKSADLLLQLSQLGASATMMNCSCERIIFVTPILLIAAAIIMLLVARFDEGYKPCPSNRQYGPGGKRGARYIHYPNFCGQTMNPRVTTCCRVPCFQNFTTNFDEDGNPDDCFTQTFAQFSVAIVGFCILGVSLFALLMIALEHYIKRKSKSHSLSLIDNVFSLSNPFAKRPPVAQVTAAPQRMDTEAIPDIDNEVIPDIATPQAHARAAGAEGVQVV
jgi:hypothetical protein